MGNKRRKWPSEEKLRTPRGQDLDETTVAEGLAFWREVIQGWREGQRSAG